MTDKLRSSKCRWILSLDMRSDQRLDEDLTMENHRYGLSMIVDRQGDIGVNQKAFHDAHATFDLIESSQMWHAKPTLHHWLDGLTPGHWSVHQFLILFLKPTWTSFLKPPS